MEVYWNKLTLDRPPTTSWHCASKDFDHRGFLNAIEKVIHALELQTIFRTEAAILSRLIYRMKSKLRSDKGLKNMEKVNRALLNYLRLSLEKDYKYLTDNVEYMENIQALPSRQMLQYVLVRTQGFAKLMYRIETMAQKANSYFRTRISLGQAWNMSLVAYAVVSRIWLLSRCLTKKCCNWYNKVYQYHDKLKTVGVPWLPETYCLPEDLKTWLNIAWINEDFEKIAENDGLSNGIFIFISQNKDAVDDLEFAATEARHAFIEELSTSAETAGIAPTAKNSCKLMSEKKRTLHTASLDEIGKRISRDEFVANLATESAQAWGAKQRKMMVTEAPKEIPEVQEKPRARRVKCKKRRNPKYSV